MLSREYRESIERRFHAFCKAVLHNEACDYYRDRTVSYTHLDVYKRQYINKIYRNDR